MSIWGPREEGVLEGQDGKRPLDLASWGLLGASLGEAVLWRSGAKSHGEA